MMSDTELEELAADIKKNGQREPVLFALIDGKKVLIDGRNRLAACFLAHHEPVSEVVDEDEATLEALITSKNVHRRHLTPEQRQARLEAAIVANPTASARAIGEKVGVDKNKVVKARKKLEATGAVRPVQKTVGKDGKARKAPAKAKPKSKDLTTTGTNIADGISAAIENITTAGTSTVNGTGAAIDGLVAQGRGPRDERRAAQGRGKRGNAAALAEFKEACDHLVPLMDKVDLAEARIHFNSLSKRADTKRKSA